MREDIEYIRVQIDAVKKLLNRYENNRGSFRMILILVKHTIDLANLTIKLAEKVMKNEREAARRSREIQSY